MMSDVEVYDAPSGGKDYVLQVRIKNGPLLRAIRSRGYRTVTAFSAACGVHVTTLSEYLGLRRAPIRKTGEWNESALRMARSLRLPPDSLFPEQHLEQALVRNSGELEVSGDELRAMLAPPEQQDPEQAMIADDVRRAMGKLLLTLSPREERVVRLRFGIDGGGDKTLQDVADEYGLSRNRVRQIEFHALLKLKKRWRELAKAGCEIAEVWQENINFSARKWVKEARAELAERVTGAKDEPARVGPQFDVWDKPPIPGHCHRLGNFYIIRAEDEWKFLAEATNAGAAVAKLESRNGMIKFSIVRREEDLQPEGVAP